MSGLQTFTPYSGLEWMRTFEGFGLEGNIAKWKMENPEKRRLIFPNNEQSVQCDCALGFQDEDPSYRLKMSHRVQKAMIQPVVRLIKGCSEEMRGLHFACILN